MKVALVHDWLTGMRGGEKVLECFCEIYPEADIFTLVHVPGSVSSIIEGHRIVPSILQKFPWARQKYRWYLALMPWAVEQFDMSEYDLVISSSHCVAKGAKTDSRALHICYCHTPMRYVWDQYDNYFQAGQQPLWVRSAMGLIRRPLQRWDVKSSQRVSHFVANSQNVAGRIQRCYGRSADVIYPPVDFHRYQLGKKSGGFFLVVSALVPYKRIDIAVEAFNRLGRPLRIVGSGPDERRLRKSARSNVSFLGWLPESALLEQYQTCEAILFPTEEDFGIVPLEAMACGKPVIAYGAGGALETVVPLASNSHGPQERRVGGKDPSGIFFKQQTADSIFDAVRHFDAVRGRFNPSQIRKNVRAFDRARFIENIKQYIGTRCEYFQRGP